MDFCPEGARVAAGVRNRRKAERLVPRDALAVQLNVTNDDEVKGAVEAVINHFGRIDVLINNAGIYPRIDARQLSASDWTATIDTNLTGAFRCARASIPHFVAQESGAIINVGSIALRLGMPSLTHYLSSKGGIVGLTRGLARDLGVYGVRVNCLHLGAVQTEGELELFPDQEALLREMNSKQSCRGRLTPESIEAVFAFFASELSQDITGQCLTVDRGWTHD